ncbi:rCG39752 [Rattus norvegicus]|uniref:RCG39752 n=1 Tax=Rattus norvegicus TaxID=10116 RepID=A6I663_RAT|nr:rCG39752 [Rattus norvegicus]
MLICIICVFYFSLLSFSKEMHSLVVRIHTARSRPWIGSLALVCLYQ